MSSEPSASSEERRPGPRRRRSTSRRRFVLASVGALSTVVLAGCLGGDGESSAGNDSTATASSDESGSADTTTAGSKAATSASESSGDLDLREANVVGVEAERNGEEYSFDVTLHHDDGGESGYANWWQVETLGGERLGRRELLHAHGTEPFTRSATIGVPEEVPRVVVRGHDEVHEYGGQAVVVTLASGETRAVKQGSDPQAFGTETTS